MTYTKQTWVNGPGGGTPLDAARLNHIEDGLSSATTQQNLSTRGSTGIIMPLYVYPASIYTNSDYNGIIALARTHPLVPFWIVLNPDNGPGTVADGNYTVAIRRLQAAGATVLGYIATAYAVTAYSTAIYNVDKWQELYPDIDGIFVDEMNNIASTPHVNYYRDLTQYCHDNGLNPVVGNPGAGSPGEFFATVTADVIMIHENNAYPLEADIAGDYGGGYADYPVHRRGALVYNQTLDLTKLAMMRKYVGFIYVTDDSGSGDNPWNSVSSSLSNLLIKLDPSGWQF